MNVLGVWKGHLSAFIKFLSEEVETLFWESVLKYLIQNLVLRSFLKNGFGATLSSRTNILSVWKGHFSVFIKFLNEEVEILFWESEAKRSKLFKSTFGQRTLLRKWFWSYLELKNECSERFKRAFLGFLQNFCVTKLKLFFEKVRQSVQNYLNQNLVIGSFLENDFEATLSWKTNLLSVWKGYIFFFESFWVTNLKPFSGKVRWSMQNNLNQNLVLRSFLENGFEGTLSSKINILSV